MFRIAYQQCLSHNDTEAFMKKVWGMHQDGVPSWQKVLLNVAMPGLRFFIKHQVSAQTNEETDVAQKEVDNVISEVLF